ncbi:EAL domain-containing protein [Alginatibacterium sediminis]|uniref:EAL domain-containing protein n=1 Tax=Alginatibacterium sediminis TaxID=2164068 RepID=A0A420EG91_9ALTE|nr:EAL domain-containing protein [Alginatibacterium sediminis]RKF19697.1 EAL domain-containing protein [Alginatibacterium sediminis]
MTNINNQDTSQAVSDAICMWSLDRRTRKIEVDDNYLEIVGEQHQGHILLDDFIKLFSTQEAKRVALLVAGVIANKGMEQTHTVVHSKKGGSRLLELTLWLSPEFDYSIQGTLQLVSLIPSQSSIDRLLFNYFSMGNFSVIVADQYTNIIYSNHHANQSFGYDAHELLGSKTRIFNARKHDKEFYTQLWSSLDTHGFWHGKILTKHKNGDISPLDSEIHKVVDSETSQPFYIAISRNIKGSTHRLTGRNIGGIDLETYLPVKSKLIDNIAGLIRSKQEKRTVISVAFAPLTKGDKAISTELSQAFHSLINDYHSAYCGNQQYVVAFRCNSDLDTILSRIKQLITHLRSLNNRSLSVAISQGNIGISVFGRDANNATDLVEHSILAMVESHATDGSNISFYDDNIHLELSRKEGIPDYLNDSLDRKAIEPWYQAIVSTQTWRIVKFEALCRFQNASEFGYRLDELIAVAEQQGRITELDDTICLKALNDLSTIHKLLSDNSIGLTLNRSLYNDVASASLPKALTLVLDSKVAQQNITLEITESAYFEGNSQQQQQLEAIRKQGVSIAIDDFGTGYSSFSYLYQSRFDLLKIDQSFVRNLKKATKAYFIVETIVMLAKKLGIEVIAEGVETLEETQLLYELGVTYLQGFYFSKPLPISDIKKSKNYYKNIDKLSSLHVTQSAQKLGVFCNKRHPTISLDGTFKQVLDIFDHCSVSSIPVLAEGKCVGLIEREAFGYVLSPTTGGVGETKKDLENLNRHIQGIVKRSFSQIDAKGFVSNISSMMESSLALPWVVCDTKGMYLGMIDEKMVMDYLLLRVRQS